MANDLPYLCSDIDRHGNVRIYVRAPGPARRKTRLHEKPGTKAFMVEYRRALDGRPAHHPSKGGKRLADRPDIPKSVRAFIYVIAAGPTLSKVGMSTNPERRLSGLATANAGRIALRRIFAVSPTDARRLERAAHIHLQPHRKKGEWFRVGVLDASAAIEQMAAALSIEVRNVPLPKNKK